MAHLVIFKSCLAALHIPAGVSYSCTDPFFHVLTKPLRNSLTIFQWFHLDKLPIRLASIEAGNCLTAIHSIAIDTRRFYHLIKAICLKSLTCLALMATANQHAAYQFTMFRLFIFSTYGPDLRRETIQVHSSIWSVCKFDGDLVVWYPFLWFISFLSHFVGEMGNEYIDWDRGDR